MVEEEWIMIWSTRLRKREGSGENDMEYVIKKYGERGVAK